MGGFWSALVELPPLGAVGVLHAMTERLGRSRGSLMSVDFLNAAFGPQFGTGGTGRTGRAAGVAGMVVGFPAGQGATGSRGRGLGV